MQRTKGVTTLGIALALAAAAACSSSRPLAPDGGAGMSGGGHEGGADASDAGPPPKVYVFQQSVNRNVDVLFMVDNSAGMTVMQLQLVDAFASYMDVLKGLPAGLPNIHLGVVSSNMGAGRNPSIELCMPGGDRGIFQSAPTSAPACQRASLNADQHFIVNNMGMTNYQGDIADVFSCIAMLGDQGCGFEHQLESVLRALGADGGNAPAENAGFLRSDAYLQVVLITDEDDCSAPPNSPLFDSSSMTVADQWGPLQSYRCNEFGHLCGGKRPPRTPPGEVDLSGTCVSAEDGTLIRVADVVAALKSLKSDPSKILVAAIAGPPTPYKVNVGPSEVKTDTSQWPYVEHSCTGTTANGMTVSADPAVRIKQWVDAFGDNGVFEERCTDSFARPLQTIAEQIGKAMSPRCLPAALDVTTCTFTDETTDATGAVVSTPLPQCVGVAGATGATACWYTRAGTTQCPSGQSVFFNRAGPAPAPTDLVTTATCPQ
jgi:hypothetical protein